MTREETQAEARAIYQCDYDERAGRPTETEARLAGEVVALLRERDAYRKAKQENDDRFMRERANASRPQHSAQGGHAMSRGARGHMTLPPRHRATDPAMTRLRLGGGGGPGRSREAFDESPPQLVIARAGQGRADDAGLAPGDAAAADGRVEQAEAGLAGRGGHASPSGKTPTWPSRS